VELIAQGLANLVSPLVGGLPATGAIARTATNIRSGARTPVAGMIHAVTLLVVLVAAAPLARFVPLSVLAAILLVVAYQMGEWAEIPQLLRLSKADIAVWITTFFLTVVADLTVAVQTGMILAMFMFIRKVARTTTVENVSAEDFEDGRLHVLHEEDVPDYVTVFRIYGPLLFGASDKVLAAADRLDDLPPIVLLKLRHMTAIDATGLRALEDFADRVQHSGRALVVCGAPLQPAALMRSADFREHVGVENICANTTEALSRAAEIYRAGQHVA
jgi:sulfate permease, SulP family